MISASEIHGMSADLVNEDEIIAAIEEYSEYGSSIERKNLNIKWLLGLLRRYKAEASHP